MNASVATVTMSKKSAAIEAVNQLIRTTDMNQEGKECTVINSSEPVQEPSDASSLPGMSQSSSQEVVSVPPKKRAAPKKTKKNDEATAASTDEVVPSVEGEVVPVEEKPKKRAAPKKTKKNDEATVATDATAAVVEDGEAVPVEEKPKKRAAPKKTKKNDEATVATDEAVDAVEGEAVPLEEKPKKRAAPKKIKKNDEATVATNEAVDAVEGEAVPLEEKPKKRAAPKKTKKNDEAATDATVIVDDEAVPVEEKPKKRAAPKKTKKNEENVVVNEQTSAILEEDIISNVVVDENITKMAKKIVDDALENALEETKETKKITTLRAPIDYLQPFLHNVPNVASFPQELKGPFEAWLKTLGESEWKTMSIFPSINVHPVTKLSELVVEGLCPSDQKKEDDVHTQNMDDFEEIELIVEECVIEGELYLIDSDQNLYHPETLAYVRNMNYET